MSLDFGPGTGNFMHILFITEQRWLGNPDRFPGGAMRDRILRLQEAMAFGRLRSAKTLAIFAILENFKRVDRWIACLIRDAFGVHSLNESLGAGTGELLRVDVENVGVVTVASATRSRAFAV